MVKPASSHQGARGGWGSLPGRTLPPQPPLGAPRWCVRALCAPLPPADSALGNSEGESRCANRRATATPPGEPRRARAPRPPAHVTRYLYRPVKRAAGLHPRRHDSYLVDSASSHMLVSKIKPCMSKYKQLYSETANGSLNQLSFI